jgi:hypothetical protein
MLGKRYFDNANTPFQGFSKWCTTNTPDCTLESLLVSSTHNATGTGAGGWVSGNDKMQPGGYGHNQIRITGAAGGSQYRIRLRFEVPATLYNGTNYAVPLKPHCRADKRFFSSRISVVNSDWQTIMAAESFVEGTLARPEWVTVHSSDPPPLSLPFNLVSSR